MPLLRFRFTVRVLMAAVAMAAVAATWVRLNRDSVAYQKRAAWHRGLRFEADCWLSVEYRRGGIVYTVGQRRDYLDEAEIARLERLIAFHAALGRKYERAARHPWLPVEPDPPDPK